MSQIFITVFCDFTETARFILCNTGKPLKPPIRGMLNINQISILTFLNNFFYIIVPCSLARIYNIIDPLRLSLISIQRITTSSIKVGFPYCLLSENKCFSRFAHVFNIFVKDCLSFVGRPKSQPVRIIKWLSNSDDINLSLSNLVKW